MKRMLLLSVLFLAATSLAVGGEIYGKITEKTTSVGEEAAVAMKCGAKAYPAVKTDKTGSYHVVVAESGKCAMTVKYKEKEATLDVASYDDAVQVDVVLEFKDGKLTARRK